VLNLEKAIKLNPGLNKKLFLPSPGDVLRILEEEPVKSWLRFIARNHVAPRKELLLLVPCSPRKPYDPPRDELHRRLLELEKRHNIYLVSVSEPLCLEPREYWSFRWGKHNLIYDAPFFPWIERYGYKWSDKTARMVWEKLGRVAELWYERNKHFRRVVSFATPSSGYRKIVEKMGVDVFVPDFEPDVEVSYENNTDIIYTHPDVWKALLDTLRP